MSDMTCQDIFESQLPETLGGKPDVVKAINAAYQFDITGDGGGQWVVDLTKETDFISSGLKDNANVTVTMDAENFVKLVKKELNPQMAFMTGKIKIKGDMSLALKLQQILG